MESCTPLLFAPTRTGISCSNLRLAWPAVCITGKCSRLGSLRSFPEPFFFLSISYFLDNSGRLPASEFGTFKNKTFWLQSPELSLAKTEQRSQSAVGISSQCQSGEQVWGRGFQLCTTNAQKSVPNFLWLHSHVLRQHEKASEHGNCQGWSSRYLTTFLAEPSNSGRGGTQEPGQGRGVMVEDKGLSQQLHTVGYKTSVRFIRLGQRHGCVPQNICPEVRKNWGN